MIPINSLCVNLCDALKKCITQKHYNQVPICEKCLRLARELLVYCKTTSGLPLHEREFIEEAIKDLKNLPDNSDAVKTAEKIQKILNLDRLTSWPTLFPKACISKNSSNLLDNGSLDPQMDLDRLLGVISFLKNYSHLLDPSYERSSSDQIKLNIISSFFHLNSPFHLNFTHGLLESQPELNPLILDFLSKSQDQPLHKCLYQSLQESEIKSIHSIRVNLLKEFFSYQPKREEFVAIIGAGPAGLLRAILCSLFGYETILLEKRPHHFDREAERNNVLVLGYPDSSDLDILSILGIWDKLIECNALTPCIYTSGYYLTISDLEKSSLQVFEELYPKTFYPEVQKIYLEADSNQEIKLSFNNLCKSLHGLIICDGAHSQTLNSLGIKKNKYAQSAYAVTASFERKTPLNKVQVLTAFYESIGNIKLPEDSLCSDALKLQAVENGVLLRHKQDYLGFSLKLEKPQKKMIKSQQNLQQLKRITTKAYAQLLKIRYSEDIALNSTSPVSCSFVSLKMKQTESPLFLHESLPILIRGDAYGSVHSISAYGAKTAIESLKADGVFFSYFKKNKPNEKLNNYFVFLAEQIFLKAQNSSLYKQHNYIKANCDKPYFFLNQAKKRNLITEDSQSRLNTIIIERKLNFDFEKNSHFLLSLKEEIILNFWARYGNGYPLFDDNNQPSSMLLDKASKWGNLLKGSNNNFVIEVNTLASYFHPLHNFSHSSILHSLALSLIGNYVPEEVETMDLAVFFGTLHWINYFALNTLPKNQCSLL